MIHVQTTSRELFKLALSFQFELQIIYIEVFSVVEFAQQNGVHNFCNALICSFDGSVHRDVKHDDLGRNAYIDEIHQSTYLSVSYLCLEKVASWLPKHRWIS